MGRKNRGNNSKQQRRNKQNSPTNGSSSNHNNHNNNNNHNNLNHQQVQNIIKNKQKKTTKLRGGSGISSNIRGIILAACAGYFFQLSIKSRLLPYGPATNSPKIQYAAINRTNNILQGKCTYG